MKRKSKVIITRQVLGKNLYCLQDQSAPDLDVAAVEKRLCNAVIAKYCKFEHALDAFAGVGVSSKYWARCTRNLYLVENRTAAMRLLQKNIAAIEYPGCRIHLIAGRAQTFLQDSIQRGMHFDLVDCDPFGTCYELLPLVAQVITKGIVCLTSGEILQVYRGLNRRKGRPPANEFRGRKAVQWVTELFIPEILSFFKNAKLIHFYVYPTSVRIILSLGGFLLPQQAFQTRPQILGWFSSDDGPAQTKPI